MRNCCLFALLIVLFFVVPAWAEQEPSPDHVMKKMKSAIETAQTGQKRLNEWEEEKRKLEDEIIEMRIMAKWYEHQSEQHLAYIQEVERNIAQIQQRREQAKRLRIQIEPFLDEILIELDEFLKQDIPFLRDERDRRLEFLEESIQDHELALNEKLRRVLETLLVECSYGEGVDAGETTLELDNRAIRGTILRIGRLAVFFLSHDGKVSARLKRDGSWTRIPDGFSRNISLALDMARKRRVLDVVVLPVGEAVK